MCRSNGIRLGLIAWILLIIIRDDVVRGQTGPNAVALVKGETTLDCIVSSFLTTQWTFTTDGNSNLSPIAFGCSVTGDKAYYRTENLGGNICRLIIANATMQLAGVYTCFDGASTTYRSLVTVIDPVASVVVYNRSEVVVDDQLNTSCSINFNGSALPAPSLRPVPYWTTSPEQIFTNATYRPSTNDATSVATIRVKKPTVPIFKCNTVFEVIGNTTGYNPIPPPDNLTVGVTPPIDVQYPPGNLTITDGNCANELEPKNLTCTADANPSAVYKWLNLANNITTSGSVLTITTDGEYKCIATNCIRNQTHSNTTVANATTCPTFPTTQAAATTSTTPSTTTSDSSAVVYVAVVISVYEIANLISMGFFLAYYNMKMDENTNGNNSNIATSNKRALNNRFPWLEKMLPCMNPSYANTGQKCLGIFLFVLITIGCGVFIFPILILLVKKPWSQKDLHESQENSTLSLRLDDISRNVSGENRFRSPPSFLPPAPPSSHGGLVNRQASSTAGPPRPPPPPNKPPPSAVQHPLRLPPPLLRPPAMNEPINRDGAMEYAFLPFAMKPNLAPVQYLDEESHYTVLRRV